MSIALTSEALSNTLERAFTLAISNEPLPSVWLERSNRLSDSPSVAAIAAFGATLLAKATDPRIDSFSIQSKDGSQGAFNLRAPATMLAKHKSIYGYDIGSSSDRDPINAGTFVSSANWRVAYDRIREDHKPFFQLILKWLAEVDKMSQEEATAALAAYIKARRVVKSDSVTAIPAKLSNAPGLTDLILAVDGFVAAHPEGGASGMALVAAAYRVAGFEVGLPSRNDPRRIDVHILQEDKLYIACEVKQLDTGEETANSLGLDAADANAQISLLAVLRPGSLVDFSRSDVARRVESQHDVVLRVTEGTRELIHEALVAGEASVPEMCQELPRKFAEALEEIRTSTEVIDGWAAVAGDWIADPQATDS